MNLKKIMTWRYAVKQFDTSKKVNSETLNRILEITNLSATSYGLQPYMTVIVKNQDLKEKLLDTFYGQTNVSDSSHVDDKYQYYKKVRKSSGEMIIGTD